MDAKRKRVLGWLFYLVLILLVAAAAVLLWPEYRRYQIRQGELAELNAAKMEKTAARNRLYKEVQDLENSPAAIEKVAREKFGLCRPGETIMRFTPTDSNL